MRRPAAPSRKGCATWRCGTALSCSRTISPKRCRPFSSVARRSSIPISSSDDLAERVEEIDRRVDLVAMDRHALGVDAERQLLGGDGLEDAPEVAAADGD